MASVQRKSLGDAGELLIYGDPERAADPATANVDVELIETGGRRWSATFFTPANIETLLTKGAASGEGADGLYVWADAMVITRDLSVDAIVRATQDLLDKGELHDAFNELEGVAASGSVPDNALLDLLSSADWSERAGAVSRLRSSPSPRAVAGLVLALDEPDTAVIDLAAEALLEIADPVGEAALVQLLTIGEDDAADQAYDQVRYYARQLGSEFARRVLERAGLPDG